MNNILVTGGSSGLGLRLTVDLLKKDNTVYATYFSNSKPLQYLQTKFHNLLALYLDLQAANSCKFCFQKLDTLILNAGIIHSKLLFQEEHYNFQKILLQNLTANYILCQQLIPLLKDAPNPHIIFVSSLSALKGNFGQGSYSASKAALIGFAKSLAKELANDNIKVNVVLPGFLKTKQTIFLAPAVIKAYKQGNVLGKIGSLGEVSSFIQWLIGSQNVSGQVFNLDSRISGNV